MSIASLVARAEHVVKGPVWGCQMCGQCVLHSTGLTCPMNCPNTLRNGPCSRLHGTSAWINLITGRDRRPRAGWAAGARGVDP